ncbi:ATP-binding cassette domain-containing protein [Nonomuraea sp. NPDC049709]|uniref:ATP-binding cassette domain-containing protein n=1 Tax=Nonomuraea sp. NPDC049709 TaxID=3154736 RepID=UPI003438FD8B
MLGGKEVVSAVDLETEPGEFLTLLGPSGCGKTTTLNMVAGHLSADGGVIEVDGRDITAVPPHRRSMGMVFQSYALFPQGDLRMAAVGRVTGDTLSRPRRRTGLLLALPAIAIFAVLFVAPLFTLVANSFRTQTGALTLGNYERFLGDPFYRDVCGTRSRSPP